MAVLPWGHSRSQTTSSTEKPKVATLDWFSKSTAEPSRQAINQLMKQHSRGGSARSVDLRDRSKTSTPTSQLSHKSQHRPATSVDSKIALTKGVSHEKSAVSQSRPSTPIKPNTSGIERSDSTSKSIFQKGGLLRRKGSKLNMTVNTSPAAVVTSPPRPSSSRAGLRGNDSTISPTKEEVRRPSISKPFDFAHVMHGDLSSFTGLGRIDESDLASQFDAIQARYRNTTELGDPLPQQPETVTPTEKGESIYSVTALPQVPSKTPTSPPPAPPPKDSPTQAFTPSDVRTSRSTENFSRPTPRSPTLASRPTSCHLQHLMQSTTIGDDREPAIVKPLPQLPTVIHAVSTQDDTARLMISAPLPSPPATGEKGLAQHHRRSSSRSSLRHMSTFPSARHPQTSTTTHDGHLLAVKEEDLLPRPHSDYELAQRVYRRHSGKFGPSDAKSLKVEDWEVAIDSAWEMEDELEVDHCEQIARPVTAYSSNRQSYLTIEQPTPESVSSPSTPLIMNYPKSSRSPAVALGGEKSPQNRKISPSLVGLGIETEGHISAQPRSSKPPALEVVTTDTSRVNVSPRLARSAYSAISHSSSQESIILSIASSIMSTQRSSISSVSVSEYAHSSKPDRTSMATSAHSPLLTTASQKAARPESTCLPSALLQEMNLEAKKVVRPDSSCLPSVSASKRNSLATKAKRPESVCLPQDMLSTFPVPEATSHRKSSANLERSKAESEQDDDDISDLPTNDLYTLVSGSRGSIVGRTSSVPITDGAATPRQRSNTQGSRTRPARVSYSLFPSAGSSGQTTTNLDIENVAT